MKRHLLAFCTAILHSTAAKTSSVRDVTVAPVGAGGGGGNVYSPSTWAKQRRSEFKAGQLSHQQSMSVSNMANTVDMDDNERKIVTEFCHYLEKSKQLFNGLRSVDFGLCFVWSAYAGYEKNASFESRKCEWVTYELQCEPHMHIAGKLSRTASSAALFLQLA